MKVSELKVVVTGAAGGLGRHFCLSLCREGASVAAVDLNADGLTSLARDAEGLPGKLRTYSADVTRPEDTGEVVRRAQAELGPLNGLVNNAGIARDGRLLKVDERREEVLRMPREQWQKVLDVNLTGPFYMAREVAAAMVESKTRPGIIINISSISRHGIVGQANYSAAKAGVAVSSRVWAQELAPFGIRVVAIAPGFVRTGLIGVMSQEALEDVVSRVPMARLGEPEEIYAGLRFSIECDYFNGRCLDIDGGLGV
ncbi:hypothetical protein BO221_44470 [Archangium sp. Cb G35]|uniref:SDR family NAD(P)-dependent oxidoreductase n=1 Tax=Archangium sp. Cb G35 TaxID=1920190 RepID=UPI0009363E81|nr:SDR family NAD(P)-dependent oxidoreductase [Archangium sp. Cb G35]OJT17623.1 hypothetical protein BO221_44470 [Archangium sp. Cb G35]